MAIDNPNTHIKDPFLLTIQQTSDAARNQTFALLSLISSEPPPPAQAEDQNQDEDEDEEQQPSAHTLEISKSQKLLYSHLANLRSLNRRLAHLVRDTKAATAASRNEVDTLHLNLQNLYYEQRHLRGEIASCANYAHAYTQLPLVAVEEFFARFPEMAEGRSEEEVMRARIEEERRERSVLEEQRAELVKRKQTLMAENAKRKEELGALDKDLEAFIDAAKPIQKTFEKEY